MRIAAILALPLLAGLFLIRPAHAAESYGACDHTITALPVSISVSGTWCLKQNLNFASASGNAINLIIGKVTIDCNGFAITGTAGTATTAVGIHALSKPDATVRHCTLQGFKYGVELISGGNNLIEDNRVLDSTYTGLRVEGNSAVQGDHSVVRRNLILDTGGINGAYGVYADGTVDLYDNTVSGVLDGPGGLTSVYGIFIRNEYGALLERNRVRIPAHNGTGKVFGIFSAAFGGMTLTGNDVLGNGSAGSAGITCAGTGEHVQNTVVNGFATGLAGCTDAGRNDVSP